MTTVSDNNMAPAYQHNGNPVSAERFYEIACDPRRSVTVQACAGAGKTWMLVSRILRALLEGGQGGVDKAPLQPHEILAITFTKKAAGEMRQRLNEWLAEFANAPAEKLIPELKARGFSEKKGGMRLSDAVSALQNLYQTVLEAGRPVQIRTFHSWFASLLRTAPLALLQELNLPSVYELLEDDTDAVRQVWPRFFETLTQDAALLGDFTATVEAHGRFQTLRALASALSKRVEFALADAHGVVEGSVQTADQLFPALVGLAALQDALAPGGVYRAEFDAAAANLGRASAVSFAAKGSELEQALTAGDFDAALSALLTAQGTPRKFSEKVPNIAQVRAAQDLAVTLQSARSQTQAWEHQQRMARLTRVLLAAFTALKRERGWIDMNDVERAAQAMLAHPELSGWLQQRLDANIRHLLIDEFQDTSPLQWQALYAWLSSYAGSGSGEAPRVFIVGDPKQSIYRFRRAEPQVFLAAQAYVCAGLGGDLLSCDHTRRNATQVVETVNTVMLAAQEVGDYADFRAHTTDSKFTGAVLSLPPIAADAGKGNAEDMDSTHWRDTLSTPRETPEETRRTLECRQAAAWLATRMVEAENPLQPQQLMVLARKRAVLTLMQDELRRLHIPALQPEKTQLGDAPEVQDIVALLDALLSPTNDLALAQTLKSPLFGCDDEDLIGLALLARLADKGSSWRGLLPKAEHGKQDWKAIATTLIQWQGWLAALPPHDALHAIYHHGDVLARFASAAPAAARERVIVNLRSLLAAALEFDGGRYATPYALVRALKGGRVKAPTTANAHAVQLLTVHGAKGLEAPLVLLLDTDGTPTRAETMGVLVDWPGEAAAPTRFTFLASETRPPLCNAQALATEQAARQREELNALYVAMTRARHTLVLSSATPARPAVGSWWARVQPLTQAVQDVSLEAVEVVTDTTAAVAETFSLPELPFVHIGCATPATYSIAKSVEKGKSAPTGPTEDADDTDARIGKAMHRLLEGLPLASDLPAVLWTGDHLAAVAHSFDLNPTQAAQAHRTAQAIRQGDAAWVWDADLIAWHGNEVPLAVHGQQRRIDRLVQRSDTQTWWVLDYKSTADPLRNAEHCAQLHGYRSAVQKNTPGQAVRAAFLTPQGSLIELNES